LSLLILSNLKHELLNRLRSTMAANVLTFSLLNLLRVLSQYLIMNKLVVHQQLKLFRLRISKISYYHPLCFFINFPFIMCNIYFQTVGICLHFLLQLATVVYITCHKDLIK
jgi:hypothetical protein